jgi:hypothetical protein
MATLRTSPHGAAAHAAASVAALVVVFVFLAVSPAPVTFPDHHWELLLLLAGGAALLAANLILACGPLPARRRPSRRAASAAADAGEVAELRRYEHFHVVTPDGVLGVVSEALADREGRSPALVVSTGWFGTGRFLVPLDDVVAIDEAARELCVGDDGVR